MHLSRFSRLGLLLATSVLAMSVCRAQVPTPVSVLGHAPGDDFYLAD
jgi:hypothetical protein